MLSRFCIVKWKRGFRCSIWWSTRWGSQLSSSRLGQSLFNFAAHEMEGLSKRPSRFGGPDIPHGCPGGYVGERLGSKTLVRPWRKIKGPQVWEVLRGFGVSEGLSKRVSERTPGIGELVTEYTSQRSPSTPSQSPSQSAIFLSESRALLPPIVLPLKVGKSADSQGPTPEWPQVLKSDSKMGSEVTFESLLGHFGVGLPESLLSHFWVTLILSGCLWT